jgi:hypothetical protein
MIRVAVLLVLGLATVLPRGLHAQAGPQEELDFLVSVNPLALVAFGVFAADFEQVLTRGTSAGGSVFYANGSDRKYIPHWSANGVLRYYTSGRSFEGFAVGALLGYMAMRDEGETRGAIGFGFSLEHAWLLGEDERLGITAGAGGQRLFYLSERGSAGRATPSVRLSLGWAF